MDASIGTIKYFAESGVLTIRYATSRFEAMGFPGYEKGIEYMGVLSERLQDILDWIATHEDLIAEKGDGVVPDELWELIRAYEKEQEREWEVMVEIQDLLGDRKAEFNSEIYLHWNEVVLNRLYTGE